MNEEVSGVPASQRLRELGLTLPDVPQPAGAYVPALASSGLVWTAGQLPFVDGKLAVTGTVGSEVSVEQAAEQARICAINALAAAASVAGGVDGIRRILRVVVYVASAPGFGGQPQVANGASALLGDVFGSLGVHVRSAVGVAALPMNAPVEVELVVEANAASF